jgi:hypothetical protein
MRGRYLRELWQMFNQLPAGLSAPTANRKASIRAESHRLGSIWVMCNRNPQPPSWAELGNFSLFMQDRVQI